VVLLRLNSVALRSEDGSPIPGGRGDLIPLKGLMHGFSSLTRTGVHEPIELQIEPPSLSKSELSLRIRVGREGLFVVPQFAGQTGMVTNVRGSRP
jgi:hypothetical protein